jgi:hypothetical protein
MSLPNYYYVKAILESYFNMNDKDWGLKDPTSHLITLPAEDTKQGHKVEVCKKILQRVIFHNASLDEWIETAEMLHDLENAEQKAHDDRLFITKLFVYPPKLRDTLQAVRSYILSIMTIDAGFIEKLKELSAEREALEASIAIKTFHKYPREEIDKFEKQLAAIKNKQRLLKDNSGYFQTFYNEQIKLNDPKSAELKEKSFDDFIKNVNKGFRSSPVCDLLIKAIRATANIPEQPKSILKNSNRTSTRHKNSDSTSPLRANSTFETTAATAPRRKRSTTRVGFDESRNDVKHVSNYINNS